jgi:hypothetical protein
MSELNPNHPVTNAIRELWYKMAAVMLHKYDLGEVVITSKDLDQLTQVFGGELPVVAVIAKDDGLHLKLVTETEGKRLSLEATGLPQ